MQKLAGAPNICPSCQSTNVDASSDPSVCSNCGTKFRWNMVMKQYQVMQGPLKPATAKIAGDVIDIQQWKMRNHPSQGTDVIDSPAPPQFYDQDVEEGVGHAYEELPHFALLTHAETDHANYHQMLDAKFLRHMLNPKSLRKWHMREHGHDKLSALWNQVTTADPRGREAFEGFEKDLSNFSEKCQGCKGSGCDGCHGIGWKLKDGDPQQGLHLTSGLKDWLKDVANFTRFADGESAPAGDTGGESAATCECHDSQDCEPECNSHHFGCVFGMGSHHKKRKKKHKHHGSGTIYCPNCRFKQAHVQMLSELDEKCPQCKMDMEWEE